MTSTQLYPSPSVECPSWCECPTNYGWEQLSETGQLTRGHYIGAVPSMPEGGGHMSVEASGEAMEYVDGTPTKFGVLITSPGVTLTPEQALHLGEQLVALARKVHATRDQVRGTA